MVLPFKHPFSAIVAGPSQAGKSQWVARLIKHANSMISPPPKQIHICYGEWQSLYDTFQGVQFHQGLIDIDTLDPTIPKLLILDDLMDLLSTKEGMIISQTFSKFGHHKQISIVLIVQNMFYKGSNMRTCSLNSHYNILFKNPRDQTQINCLARQMYPNKSRYMLDAFNEATSVKYGYLLVDLKQDTDEAVRLRTNIFPNEYTYIYLSRDQASHLTSEARQNSTL